MKTQMPQIVPYRVAGFDAAPDARPLFKERLLWTLVIGLFFFLIYGSANQISALTAPHPALFFEWEKQIPFVPELILPYMSSDILFILAFLAVPDRDSLQRLGLRCGLAIVISALIFLIWPLQFSFTKPPVSGWPAPLFEMLSLDHPFNQFPSLHISLGYLAWQAICRRISWFWRIPVTAWFVMILLSTVMVYQHHSIDILGGILVVALLHLLIPSQGPGLLPVRFVSPRHLHMAWRYLLVATLLTLLAFQSIYAALPVGWVALSLILVTGAYICGANGILGKGRKGYSLLIWLMAGPYLMGSWLNWRWWRGRVRPFAELAPGLLMGMRPDAGLWRELEGQKVTQVIDLVPELAPSVPDTVNYSHIPLLDIAIPAPQILDNIAREIEAARSQGTVLVHCALGMSRSAMACAAWLMRQGATPEEALAKLDKARPERVDKPYIRIALDLYHCYLRDQRGE